MSFTKEYCPPAPSAWSTEPRHFHNLQMLNFAQSTERFGKIYNNNLKSTKSTTFDLQFKIGRELPLSLKVYAVFKCFQAKLTSVTCTPHHHNLSCFTNFTLFAKVLVQKKHRNGQKPPPIFKCLNDANLVWYFSCMLCKHVDEVSRAKVCGFVTCLILQVS